MNFFIYGDSYTAGTGSLSYELFNDVNKFFSFQEIEQSLQDAYTLDKELGIVRSEDEKLASPTWPYYFLQKFPEIKSRWLGYHGGIGNDLISFVCIRDLVENLSLIKKEGAFVIIIWSTACRRNFYASGSHCKFDENGSPEYYMFLKHYFLNPGFLSANMNNPQYKLSKIWYESFQNDILDLVMTYNNVLRTQWFLEKNNIKYIMGSIDNLCFYEYDQVDNKDKEDYLFIDHLRSQINFDLFLPTMSESIYEHFRKPFHNRDFGHPHRYEYEWYVNNIMLPFIQEKYKTLDFSTF